MKKSLPVQDEQDIWDAEERFEAEMEVPEICTDKNVQSTSWFTQEGIKWFQEALDTLVYYADIYLDSSIKIESIEYDGEPLYKDWCQVVIPTIVN